MFGSTAILPPRTKRWAEAKVLADCINLKVWCQSHPASFSLAFFIAESTDLQAISIQQ